MTMRLILVLAASLFLGSAFAAECDENIEYIDTDAITPVSIEHRSDEVYAEGVRVQRYNFINYHFEKDGAYIVARTYLDEIGDVKIDGPFKSRDDLKEIDDPAFRDLVVAYLKRRFFKIEVHEKDAGYVTVWEYDSDKSE